MRSLPCAALAAALFVLSASAQDVAGPGFALAPAAYPGAPAFGATTTLSNGDIVVFDGLDVFQYASNGALLFHLGSVPSFVFPSFVLAHPSEDEIYVGESSGGTIMRFFTGQTSNPDVIATLPFNYDAAIFDGSALFVSAATCGFGCGNQIWSIDLSDLQTHQVAQVPGASGPLAFDGQGNLYYATASAAFPPPPNPTKILRWSAAQLAGPSVLGLADAQFLGVGFEGAARLAFDRRVGALYLAEVSFASGANRIRRVLGGAAQSPILLEGQGFRSITNLCLQSGSGAARFGAYQPASDAFLTYTTTDCVAPPERFELLPRRPSATLTGAGTSGPGPFALELHDGPPGGFARLVLCAPARFHTPERVFQTSPLPLFFGADLLGGPAGLAGKAYLPLDASGSLALDYVNPGGLVGQWAAQFEVFDSAPLRVAGTSSAAFL